MSAGTVTRQYGTVGAGDGGRCGAGTGVVVARSGYMAATTPGFALAELGEGSEVVAASALAISVWLSGEQQRWGLVGSIDCLSR